MSIETTLLERWFWLISSIIIAIFVVIVRWILERPNSRFSEQTLAWQERPYATWIIHSLRMLYAVGIPALVLFWRKALTERGLGLQPFLLWSTENTSLIQANLEDWIRDLGWSLFIAGCTLAVLYLGQTSLIRLTKTTPHIKRNVGVAVREAVYHQVHWAFYREPFVLLWGPAAGAWLGLVPLFIETAANPTWWKELRSPDLSRNLLNRVAMAIAGALIYIQTQNLWMAILVDVGIGLLLGRTEESQS